MPLLDVCPVEELPPGEVKIVHVGELALGVYNLNGELYCIEDRCSHDDGPLAEGDFDVEEGYAVCPRHGSAFELATGQPRSLPAWEPVATYPVEIVDGVVRLTVD